MSDSAIWSVDYGHFPASATPAWTLSPPASHSSSFDFCLRPYLTCVCVCLFSYCISLSFPPPSSPLGVSHSIVNGHGETRVVLPPSPDCYDAPHLTALCGFPPSLSGFRRLSHQLIISSSPLPSCSCPSRDDFFFQMGIGLIRKMSPSAASFRSFISGRASGTGISS